MPPHADPATRLWRARRRHDHVDACLCRDTMGWELRYFRNGRPMLTWRFATAGEAASEADGRLRALQRAGWNAHW